MNREVDEYIKKQKSPQRDICLRLRGIIFGTFPEIEEEMKWGVPTYAKGKFYLVALKDHVNLGFSTKGLSRDDQQSFEGSGKTMKIIKVSSVEEISEKEIVKRLKLVWGRQEAKMG
jgi:hypothetical protein